MLRAYIGREFDRIEGGSARRELEEYLDGSRREREPDGAPEPEAAKASPPAPQRDPAIEEAYRVLNLKPTATLSELRAAYRKLSERSLPTNFPEGSEERKKAEQIHERVQNAYDLILPLLDPRLRRFRSLWLE